MWSEIFINYSVFILEMMTVVVVIAVILAVILLVKQKNQAKAGELRITHLNQQYEEQQQLLKTYRLADHQVKQLEKTRKKQEKTAAKANKKKAKQQPQCEEDLLAEQKPCLFVLDFNGDIQANATAALREELNAILAVARPDKDEVLLRLESPGGVVHGYGFAASQLQRLRDRKIKLTIAVDKVAASGGYMMASVANKIVAAPFAIIGSIGVVAQVPNVHRLLKKHDVDVELMTAGEYKRTVTVFGENTEKGKQKFQQELEETHQLFKQFVAEHRPQVEIEKVATGEHWFGKQALALALIDEVNTSDELILQAIREKEVLQVKYCLKKSLIQKFGKQAEESAYHLLEKALYQYRKTFF